MAWHSRRKDGPKYLYRSRRIDGRVVKQYLGRSPHAKRIAREMDERRQHGQAERDARQAELARFARPDALLAELAAGVRLLVHASLIAAGFHAHHRSWRKRRCQGRHSCP